MGLREDIAESLSSLEGGQNATSGQENTQTADTSAVDRQDPPSGEGKQSSGFTRDDSGRFAPRHAAKDATVQDGQPGAQVTQGKPTPQAQGQKGAEGATEGTAAPAQQAQGAQQGAQQQQDDPAPVSWKAEEREAWATVPPAARAAIMRREQEVNTALRTSASARQFTSEMTQVLSPYMAMIEAEGSTATKAVQNLLETAAFIRTAPPAQKAQAIAQLIVQHAVPVDALDMYLRQSVGQMQDPNAVYQQSQINQQIQRALAPIQQTLSRIAPQQQDYGADVNNELEAFLADPKNEFARDVMDDMADILELAARRGQQMSLQDAYRRATLVHPTISKVIQSRSLNGGAAQQNAAAAQALNASVSVSGTTAPRASEQDESDGSLRGDLISSMRVLNKSSRL